MLEDEHLEAMDEADIESIIWHGVAKGHVKPSGFKDGQPTFSLTEDGEQHAEELFGGKEVLEVAQKLNSQFVQHGVMGYEFPKEKDFIIFIMLAVTCHAFKYYGDWQSLLKACKGGR